MSKRPCLSACCLATTHIHPVWLFYSVSFIFFYFFFPAQRPDLNEAHCVTCRHTCMCTLHTAFVFMPRCVTHFPFVLLSFAFCFFHSTFRRTARNHFKGFWWNDVAYQERAPFFFSGKRQVLVAWQTRLMMLNFMRWDCYVSGKEYEHTTAGEGRFCKVWNATSESRHKQAPLSNASWI